MSSSEPPGFLISITPADLGLLRLEPEEFSIWELNRYIHDLKKKGLDPGGYLVDRDLKYAMPLSCLIMVALGIALSLDPLPRHLSLGRSFGLAILIGFGYWLAAGLTSSLGHSGFMPAWFAAWSPNFCSRCWPAASSCSAKSADIMSVGAFDIVMRQGVEPWHLLGLQAHLLEAVATTETRPLSCSSTRCEAGCSRWAAIIYMTGRSSAPGCRRCDASPAAASSARAKDGSASR